MTFKTKLKNEVDAVNISIPNMRSDLIKPLVFNFGVKL